MNRTDAICLIVVVLVIVGIISALTYSWYSDTSKDSNGKKSSNLVARDGDLVEIEFTEYVWTRATDGELKYCVFQTTSKEVIEDESIPKSVTFSEILINENGSSSPRDNINALIGYDLISEMNPGFNQLIIRLSMKEGQTKTGYMH